MKQYEIYIQLKTSVHQTYINPKGVLNKRIINNNQSLFNIYYVCLNDDEYALLPILDSYFDFNNSTHMNVFYDTPEKIQKGFDRVSKTNARRKVDFENSVKSGYFAKFEFPKDIEITKEWYLEFKKTETEKAIAKFNENLENYTMVVSSEVTASIQVGTKRNDLVNERKFSKSLFRGLLTSPSSVERMNIDIIVTINNLYVMNHRFMLELTGISCGVHNLVNINNLNQIHNFSQEVKDNIMSELFTCLKEKDSVNTYIMSTTAVDWKQISKLFNSEKSKSQVDSVTRYSNNNNSGNRIATTILILK